MKRIYAPVMVGLSLALLLVGCGSEVVDDGPIEVGDEASEDTAGDETSTDDADDDGQQDDGADDTDDTSDEEAEDDADESDEEDTTTVRLYYLAPGGDTPARAGPFLTSVEREIPSTPGIALATLRELVDGPAEDDQQLLDDLSTSVPEDTLVLGVTIDDGLATVDLSREFESGGGSFSMFSRLAQVVYTVTQFPTVDEVSFELDGEPVTAFSGEGIMLDEPVSRDDYLDLLPAVFVDEPAAGAEVESGMEVTGMATVFEATFLYRLETADGTVLDEGTAMAESGVETSPFDFTIDYDVDEEQQGTLTVWEESAQDGSVQGERVTPLTLRP
ncbi:MAG: Gmad2 immunoglobulin-like domain-containing protein [Acidimicrobiales bacterium]